MLSISRESFLSVLLPGVARAFAFLQAPATLGGVPSDDDQSPHRLLEVLTFFFSPPTSFFSHLPFPRNIYPGSMAIELIHCVVNLEIQTTSHLTDR